MRVLPLVLLLALVEGDVHVGVASQNSASLPTPTRVVEIVAERFEFWPADVAITEGDVVELRLRSDDTNHGFRLVGTSTNVIIPKRGKGIATATLSGLAPGT